MRCSILSLIMKLPQYRKLQHLLKKQILTGIYQEGDLLPSENDLSLHHKITRATVRQALAELVREGYIRKKKGKGSIVRPQRETLGLLSFRGFSEVVRATEHTGNTKLIKPFFLNDWDDNFFYPLSAIERKAGCICIERLRSVDTDPVMLEYTFIPNVLSPSLLQLPLIDQSLFKTLQHDYNIEVTSVAQDVRALPANPVVGIHLQLREKEPVLHIYRKYKTNRPDFFFYSSLYCNTTKYAIGNVFI